MTQGIISVEFPSTNTLEESISEAINIAKVIGVKVKFSNNMGVPVVVGANDTVEDLLLKK